MSAHPLVVITTRLPPYACGIGTYSWLAHVHRPEHCGPARFLVMEGAAESRLALKVSDITDFEGNPAILTEALMEMGEVNVLLHYAGRGYQRFGCPVWMPGVFSRWKKKFPRGRLTIFFHEVPGKMPFLSRHFLLGRINNRIIRQLCVVGDVLVTNSQTHVSALTRMSGRGEIHLLPVSSNIEPNATSPEARTTSEFVIFGLPFGRLQTMKLFDAEIRRWQLNGQLSMLHLIGPEEERFEAEANRLITTWPKPTSVMRHGFLPEAEIARILSRARFALTNVTAETWSKSGVFMSCAITGCAVVVQGERSAVQPFSCAVSARELEEISDAEVTSRTVSAKAWYYQNADWAVTAKRLALLSEPEG